MKNLTFAVHKVVPASIHAYERPDAAKLTCERAHSCIATREHQKGSTVQLRVTLDGVEPVEPVPDGAFHEQTAAFCFWNFISI